MGTMLPRHALREKVDIYFNAAERSQISARAQQAGLSRSAFIRRAALNQRVVIKPEGSIARWRELGKLAANLNVIAKAFNAGRSVAIEPALLTQTLAAVRLLRLELAEG